MKAVVLLALASFVSFPAWAAVPSIGALSWDSCVLGPGSDTKTYSGPGIYHQVVSGFGFDQPIQGHEVRLRITATNVFGGAGSAPLADAWRFDPAGCQAGRASADPNHAEGVCPALAPAGSIGLVSATPVGDDVLLVLQSQYAPQTPSPGQTYALFRVDYDLTNAVAGSAPPPSCGGADLQACFTLEGGTWTDASGVAQPLSFAPFQGVSWQNQPGAGCFGDLPALPSTWGRVRSLYR